MMITSMPWLKMAPNCGGQWRMQVSQLMQIDMSISSGTCFHFGLRARWLEPFGPVRSGGTHGASSVGDAIDPRVKSGVDCTRP